MRLTRHLTGPVVVAIAGGLLAATPQGLPASAVAPSVRSGPDMVRAVSATTVRLVSGDRVRLVEPSDGRYTSMLLPGSPSLRRSVVQFTLAGHVYVVPVWMSPRDRRRLDMSVFDVTRLARGARVTVRFDKGSTPHDLPGIDVDSDSARTTESGAVVVRGSYQNGAVAGVGDGRKLGDAWSDVTKVRLAGSAAASAADARYELHTLTVSMLDSSGAPERFGDVVVQNVDDGRLFTAAAYAINGEVRLSVPAGNYAVLALTSNFELLIEPEFRVEDDTTLRLNAAEADAQASVTVPGARRDALAFSVTRTSEKFGNFTFELGTYAGGHIGVQPASGDVTHGTLTSAVSAHLTRRGADQHRGPVDTKEGYEGIPSDLSEAYRRSDFAVVANRFHANGRPSRMYRFGFGFLPEDFIVFATGFPVRVPSATKAWLLAEPDVTWSQTVDAWFTFPPFRLATQSTAGHVYRAGRQNGTLDWFQGPVGPGVERAMNGQQVGRACLLCRDGTDLHGLLPLWSSAGEDLTGFVIGPKASSWSLYAGDRRLDRGSGAITPSVSLPAASQEYRLEASVQPDGPGWSLSTRVSDTWTFRSAAGRYVVPLLMPSYVPPTDLSGVGAPGRVHYRLRFGHLGGADTRIVQAGLSYSVNSGRSWRRAKLTRRSGTSFDVSYLQPERTRRHRYVTLRVRGEDASGRRVEEIAVRTYALGGGSSRTATDQRSACQSAGTTTYRCFAKVQASGGEALTRAGQPAGYGATDLRDAYGLAADDGADSTLAVLVAYDYPTAEKDLNIYRRQYGLPPCTTANGCFTKLNQDGEQGNYPQPDQGWALEAALDLQMASAACPTCQLLLVEANVPTTGSLNRAVDAAVAAGATVTNHSYGIQEYGAVVRANQHYDHDGVTAVAASGDFGYQPASFPAASPDVVSVGGTFLRRAGNERGWRERAWAGSGSGCSAYFAKPSWQHDRACHMRMFADISAVAAPNSGVAVYDSFGIQGQRGWFVVGGTSAASPFVAGMIAAADAGGLRPEDLYGDAGLFRDVVRGTNGWCLNSYVCSAKPGYDGPTGWGTPRGLASFG